MSKHSKVPWSKNDYWQVADANNRRVCVDGFAFGSHSTEESQANTRRVIACVNACEGFSDEELEGANLFTDSIESLHEILATRRQRDELLAALEGLLEDAEAIASVIPAYGKSEKIAQARMAIGNVTE